MLKLIKRESFHHWKVCINLSKASKTVEIIKIRMEFKKKNREI